MHCILFALVFTFLLITPLVFAHSTAPLASSSTPHHQHSLTHAVIRPVGHLLPSALPMGEGERDRVASPSPVAEQWEKVPEGGMRAFVSVTGLKRDASFCWHDGLGAP
jgi:hypothetical protein